MALAEIGCSRRSPVDAPYTAGILLIERATLNPVSGHSVGCAETRLRRWNQRNRFGVRFVSFAITHIVDSFSTVGLSCNIFTGSAHFSYKSPRYPPAGALLTQNDEPTHRSPLPNTKGTRAGNRNMNEAAETATQPVASIMGAKPSRPPTVIIFLLSAIGVMAIWTAFLIWLAVRLIF